MNFLFDYLNSVMMVIGTRKAIFLNSQLGLERRDEVLTILFRMQIKREELGLKFYFFLHFFHRLFLLFSCLEFLPHFLQVILFDHAFLQLFFIRILHLFQAVSSILGQLRNHLFLRFSLSIFE